MQIEKNKYQDFLMQVKTRIQTSQVRAILSVNAELIYLYWDIGRMIDRKQKEEGWGAAVIPNLSKDIRNELPEVKGFSERNIGRMIAFFREYPCLDQFLPQPLAKLEERVENASRNYFETNWSQFYNEMEDKLMEGHGVKNG